MGGGDLNAKKAWHPNTLKNQERVWKAEQAAAEEKKRIAELERERHLERERSELNKLVKNNQALSGLAGDDRLHWMYEKPDKKVQQEEYLLGKAIDKNHEQTGKSDADEIPAVSRRVVGSSMLTVAGDTQVDLARKLREDPLLLVKERERAARAALLNNPVQRAKLTELLRKEQENKNESKSKKKKKGKDLDNILAEKLQALSGKKGIDLASLLASGDSSSDSDEKSKKKKKKKEKINKSIYVKHNEDSEHRHKSKESSHKKSTTLCSSHKKKRATSVSDEDVDTKKKKRHRSVSESNKSQGVVHLDHHMDSRSLSSDDRQKIDDKFSQTNYVKEDRYWSDKQHLNNYRKSKEEQSSKEKYKSKDDRDVRDEHYSKTDRYSSREERHRYDRGDRNRDDCSSTSNRNFKNNRNDGRDKGHDRKDERDQGRVVNASSTENRWRSKKSSGLSEEEKAAKLAEMVAAGAEREKHRERRVAAQLAERQAEERAPGGPPRARPAARQLPDSLQSRLHSNRHYIQRDQRHMNENFAKR